jgi:hypothetical protein
VTVQRFVALACAMVATTAAAAQLAGDPIDLDHPAIAYRRQSPADRFAELNRRLQSGEATLPYEGGSGFLRSLLRALDIPIESQVLVYSKTSLQSPLISPSNPRAIYFNDSVVVAWVRGGFIEIAAQDPSQGPSFYLLPQTPGAVPRLQRDSACLGCHYSANADGVPGLFVRSIPTAPDGRQMPWLGNAFVDHRTPLADRWGGWYVTGTHGDQRHMGNWCADDEDQAAEALKKGPGSNVTSLEGRFDASSYLSAHSDIVALMVMEHQAEAHNLITRANYQTRLALRDEAAMNATLGRTGERTDGTRERIKAACEPLLRYLLFADEQVLSDPVKGSSTFAADFEARGPRDKLGRSLRELDLERRLFKYPLSYLVYSEQFDALPPDAKDYLYRGLWDVLNSEDEGSEFSHLKRSTRRRIVEILRDTKPGLPAYWDARN